MDGRGPQAAIQLGSFVLRTLLIMNGKARKALHGDVERCIGRFN